MVKEGFSLDIGYDLYKEKHGAVYGTSLHVTRLEHAKLCAEFNKRLTDEAKKGKVVKLPCGLGSIWIKVLPVRVSKSPLIDYQYYKKTGEVKPIVNPWDYYCKWHWSKKNCKVAHMKGYILDISMKVRRETNKLLNSPGGHKRFLS